MTNFIKGWSMNRIPCESDLRSEDDAIYSKAIVRCKGHDPHCGLDGRCSLDGDCFPKENLSHKESLLEIDRLREELYAVQKERDQLKVSVRGILIDLEYAVKQCVIDKKTERAFGLRYCIGVLNRLIPKHNYLGFTQKKDAS